MWFVVALGALSAALALYRLPLLDLGYQFFALAALTILFGSRVTIRFPFIKSAISISDVFIFLTMLLFGGEAAVLVGGVEAWAASFRVSKKHLTRAFNGTAMALSTFLTVEVMRLFFGRLVNLAEGGFTSKMVIAMSTLAILQYLTNSGLVATAGALRLGQPILAIWKKHYLWTCITYFAGAVMAVPAAVMIHKFGFTAFLAVTPLLGILYFTYIMYLQNVESSKAQAEQAERHMEEMRKSEERFRGAFDHAPIGMALVATDGMFLQSNESLHKILGYAAEELRATNFQALTHPDDREGFLRGFVQVVAGEAPTWQMEKRYLHKSGRAVWALVGISLSLEAQSNVPCLIFQIQDITDRRNAEAKLMHDALHDGLTGLPNRVSFMDHLQKAVARAKRRPDRLFAVFFIDLDRFKIINDSLGHQAGDELLMIVSQRLQSSTRATDTVARLGGDEFTILLEDVADLSKTLEVADRVLKTLAEPVVLCGQDSWTRGSIGIALYKPDYEDAASILRDADTAMYQAKANGKGRYEVFDESMHEHVLKRMKLEADLRHAVERQEFCLHYQPIVALDSGKLAGFEALLRWPQPDGKMISPAEFIPIAEETGLIIPLGEWALREAARQMQTWQEQYELPPSLTMSVNLSNKQFTDAALREKILRILTETRLAPHCLKLELTESVVMEKIATTSEMLKQLRKLGIQLSIDDFGTGYSSLAYLARLPLDTLKIDRSFVSQMLENEEQSEVVKAIIMLARALGLEVVAEGVETREQLRQLQLLECSFAQGYLFSRPVEAAAAGRLIEEMQQRRNLSWDQEFESRPGWQPAYSAYTI
jgi:diguanylate cyclase (GGDEF)-like protein/PAS domain S-box-containing protein